MTSFKISLNVVFWITLWQLWDIVMSALSAVSCWEGDRLEQCSGKLCGLQDGRDSTNMSYHVVLRSLEGLQFTSGPERTSSVIFNEFVNFDC